MKIIALRGPADTGKSHTINIIYQFLLRDGWTQVPGHFRVLGNPHHEDFIDVLTGNEVLIGIVGLGDFPDGLDSLSSFLKELEDLGCHIAICACRDIRSIENSVTRYVEHTFVDKTPSDGTETNRIINGIDAARILNLI